MSGLQSGYRLADFRIWAHQDESSSDNIADTDPSQLDTDRVQHGSESYSRHIAFLDGLRAFAAILVYMHHQTPFFYGVEPDIDRGFAYADDKGNTTRYLASFPIIRLFFSGGNAMVSLFYVLSGYVLSTSALSYMRQSEHRQCSRELCSAIIRRPFRLYLPPLALTMVQVILMHLPFGLAISTSSPEPQENVGLELVFAAKELIKLLNPFQKHGPYEAVFPYNPVLWTIPIELAGSILCFGTLALLNLSYGTWLRSLQLPVLTIAAASLLMVYQWAMALFVAGIVICMIDLRSRPEGTSTSQHSQSISFPATDNLKQHAGIISSVWRTLQYTALLFFGLYLLEQPSSLKNPRRALNTPGWRFLTEHTPRSYYEDEYWRFYQSIGASIILFALLRLAWLQWLFTTRPFLHLGRISFGFYLVLIPVLTIWGERIQRLLGIEGRAYNGHLWIDGKLSFIPETGMPGFSTRFWLVICLTLPVVLLVAGTATRWLVEPSVRFGRIVTGKLGFDRTQSRGHQSTELMAMEAEGLLQRTD